VVYFFVLISFIYKYYQSNGYVIVATDITPAQHGEI
jgi:hypothetical protein